jgi:hypothetical protein
VANAHRQFQIPVLHSRNADSDTDAITDANSDTESNSDTDIDANSWSNPGAVWFPDDILKHRQHSH